MKHARVFLLLIILLCVNVTKQAGQSEPTMRVTISPVDKDSGLSAKKTRDFADRVTDTSVAQHGQPELSDTEEHRRKIPRNEASSSNFPDGTTDSSSVDTVLHQDCVTDSSIVDVTQLPDSGEITLPAKESENFPPSEQIQKDLALIQTLFNTTDPFVLLLNVYSELLEDQYTLSIVKLNQHFNECQTHLSKRFEFNHSAVHVSTRLSMSPQVSIFYCHLVYGISIGRLDAVNKCLVSGNIDVNRPVYDKSTRKYHHLLYMAVASKNFNLNLVKALLSRYSNVNQVVKKGMNLLHVAILFQRVQLVEFLLSRDADVNARDSRGLTPIMMAFNVGNIYIVRSLLVTRQADLFASVGKRIACEFIFANDDEMVFFAKLLENPGLVHWQALSFATILLTLESRMRFKKAAKMVLKSNRRIDLVVDMVRFFVARGDTEIVQFFIKNGVPLASVDACEIRDPGNTLMHLAANSGNVEMVEILFECNVRIDVLDEANRTPLYIAISCEFINVIRFLVLVGAKHHLLDALHYSVYIGSILMVRETLLMLSKTDIKFCPFDVFALAVRHGHLDVLRTLLDQRISHCLLHKNTLELAFAEARGKKSTEAIDILKSYVRENS